MEVRSGGCSGSSGCNADRLPRLRGCHGEDLLDGRLGSRGGSGARSARRHGRHGIGGASAREEKGGGGKKAWGGVVRGGHGLLDDGACSTSVGPCRSIMDCQSCLARSLNIRTIEGGSDLARGRSLFVYMIGTT